MHPRNSRDDLNCGMLVVVDAGTPCHYSFHKHLDVTKNQTGLCTNRETILLGDFGQHGAVLTGDDSLLGLFRHICHDSFVARIPVVSLPSSLD